MLMRLTEGKRIVLSSPLAFAGRCERRLGDTVQARESALAFRMHAFQQRRGAPCAHSSAASDDNESAFPLKERTPSSASCCLLHSTRRPLLPSEKLFQARPSSVSTNFARATSLPLSVVWRRARVGDAAVSPKSAQHCGSRSCDSSQSGAEFKMPSPVRATLDWPEFMRLTSRNGRRQIRRSVTNGYNGRRYSRFPLK